MRACVPSLTHYLSILVIPLLLHHRACNSSVKRNSKPAHACTYVYKCVYAHSSSHSCTGTNAPNTASTVAFHDRRHTTLVVASVCVRVNISFATPQISSFLNTTSSTNLMEQPQPRWVFLPLLQRHWQQPQVSSTFRRTRGLGLQLQKQNQKAVEHVFGRDDVGGCVVFHAGEEAHKLA